MSLARPDRPHPRMSFTGWGDPALVPELPEAVLGLLRDGLGVRHPGVSAPRDPAEVELPPPSLPAGVRNELASVVGADYARDDAEARVRHLRGKSTPDLLLMRRRDGSAAPDLVLEPDSHEEAVALLSLCSEHRVAVVPFGGGSSVVGGLAPWRSGFAGVVAIDLGRLDRLLEVDGVSRLAVLEAGLRGPQAEALLAEHGFTIGHFPQSFEYATLGGFAAARSSGQASAGYGRFDEMVLGLRVATPAGSLELGRAPRSAAGPDLRQLFLGSEGAFGIITALTVRVRPVPEERRYQGWRLPSFDSGADALRELAQDGPLPTVVRLSDEVETALNLARPGEVGSGSGDGGCLAIVGYEGSAAEVAGAADLVSERLRARGGEPVEGAGEGWARERYRGPYLRDALLDAGALVETLETVTFWARLADLYAGVREALRSSLTDQGTPPVVLCHISHVYETGASLYFTVACAALEDPLEQWSAAKTAACDAILAARGSITHHHGVGVDHRPWYEREIGSLGIGALRAVKAQLDPAGIMNPGILLGGAAG